MLIGPGEPIPHDIQSTQGQSQGNRTSILCLRLDDCLSLVSVNGQNVLPVKFAIETERIS